MKATGGKTLRSNKDEEKVLQGAVKWQYKAPKTSERLGNRIEGFLKGSGSRLEKNAAVVDALNELLPEGIAEHSSVFEISSGTLKLQVDPGPYMHELRLMSGELLKHLQQQCPKSGIKKITLFPGKKTK
jgi:Dna[CI] antecedent, DciA